MDEDVAVKAGEFKDKYKVPIADALIAASAYWKIGHQDDPHYKQIGRIEALTEDGFVHRSPYNPYKLGFHGYSGQVYAAQWVLLPPRTFTPKFLHRNSARLRCPIYRRHHEASSPEREMATSPPP